MKVNIPLRPGCKWVTLNQNRKGSKGFVGRISRGGAGGKNIRGNGGKCEGGLYDDRGLECGSGSNFLEGRRGGMKGKKSLSEKGKNLRQEERGLN